MKLAFCRVKPHGKLLHLSCFELLPVRFEGPTLKRNMATDNRVPDIGKDEGVSAAAGPVSTSADRVLHGKGWKGTPCALAVNGELVEPYSYSPPAVSGLCILPQNSALHLR